MVDERVPGDSDAKSERGWERRLGKDRRKGERRTLEVPVEKDRRSGLDRRRDDRRKR